MFSPNGFHDAWLDCPVRAARRGLRGPLDAAGAGHLATALRLRACNLLRERGETP